MKDYRILETIGQGGMAVVHRAIQVTLDREVALKLIRPEIRTDPSSLRRFEREMRVCASLSHPNVIQIYDVGTFEEMLYIAMEYLKTSKTLTGALASRGRFPPGEALDILLQILDALDYCHGKGLIHRDIKPGNIMVDPTGRVTVMDFGLVKTGTGSVLTSAGAALGTPAYMAPEVLLGDEEGPGRDLWAAGLIFYQLLCGSAMFHAGSLEDLLRIILHQEYTPLSHLRPDLDPSIDDIVSMFTGARPEDRVESAAAARARVLEWKERLGAPVPANPAPPVAGPPRARRGPAVPPSGAGTVVPPRRRPVRPGTGVLAGIAALLAVAVIRIGWPGGGLTGPPDRGRPRIEELRWVVLADRVRVGFRAPPGVYRVEAHATDPPIAVSGESTRVPHGAVFLELPGLEPATDHQLTLDGPGWKEPITIGIRTRSVAGLARDLEVALEHLRTGAVLEAMARDASSRSGAKGQARVRERLDRWLARARPEPGVGHRGDGLAEPALAELVAGWQHVVSRGVPEIDGSLLAGLYRSTQDLVEMEEVSNLIGATPPGIARNLAVRGHEPRERSEVSDPLGRVLVFTVGRDPVRVMQGFPAHAGLDLIRTGRRATFGLERELLDDLVSSAAPAPAPDPGSYVHPELLSLPPGDGPVEVHAMIDEADSGFGIDVLVADRSPGATDRARLLVRMRRSIEDADPPGLLVHAVSRHLIGRGPFHLEVRLAPFRCYRLLDPRPRGQVKVRFLALVVENRDNGS